MLTKHITFTIVAIFAFLMSLKSYSVNGEFLEPANFGRHPNIILIIADDLGYGDLGSYGQKFVRTPNLDRMAAEGLRFRQFYAGSTVCAPSRCVLMTALHAGHCDIRGNHGQATLSHSAKNLTMAEVIKRAGYDTGYIGKWGLGEETSDGIPTRQGFDYFFGYLNQRHAHNYYPEFLILNEGKVRLPNVVPNAGKDGEGVASKRIAYSHDLFTEDAVKYIYKHRSRPFMLVLSYTIPHANNEKWNYNRQDGMEVPDIGTYKSQNWPSPQKAMAAMITRMDHDIGRLLEVLKELGIDEDTLVVFTSDNGPHAEGGIDPNYFDSNGPLRGIKRSLYEGGIRVPLIARWRDKIAAGVISDHVAYFPDILPTFAELVGTEIPVDIDGISFLSTLLGRSDEQNHHEYLYWEFYERGGSQAMRMGNWKAVRRPFWGEIELYDLRVDVGEKTNVADEYSDVVREIDSLMRKAHVPSPFIEVTWGDGWKGRVKTWFCNMALIRPHCSP